ncbi:MAG: amidohydrolase family protein, partial [Planctomycetota bacterium]|nr:amidohydrolase family protein [Planctomycetota bacterium]
MDTRPPIINAAEHVWVTNDPRFPITPQASGCPGGNVPNRDYSAEHLLSEMRIYGIDKVVISGVCYYGTNNDYNSYCVKTWPDKFAAFGLMVGHRLHGPGDPKNPERLEHAILEQGLAGMRLSPIYERETPWLNDPVSYPLWQKAEELGAVFNIFMHPSQIGQVADMAERFPGVKVVVDHLA